MYKRVVCVLVLAFCFLLGAETGRKAAIMASPGDDEVMGYNPTNEGPNLASDKGNAPLWASDKKIRSFSNNYKNNTYTLERRSNGDLYVCFYNNDNSRVELHRSTDDGESWSRIWWSDQDEECPSMCLTDNYVYVANATIYTTQYATIIHRISFTGQEIENVVIGSASTNDYYPHITTDAEQYSYSYTYLYVVWSRTISSTEKDIWFSSLQESDLSFVINPKVIEGSGLFDWGDYLRARIDYEYYSNTDYLHLAFWDYDDDQIYYKRSTNYGSSWSTKAKRSDDGQHPDISVYNNKVFLVYEHSSQGCTWSYSTNSGSSWSDNLHFSTPRHYPRCHVTSGRWHMAAYRNNRVTWYYIANPTPSGTWTYTYVSDGTVPNASALDQDIYASSNTNVGLCWRGTDGAYFDASWRVNPPVADFSASPRSGCAPLTVHFTDLSTGNPTAWSWDFGDGGSSSQQNPTHAYNNAGTYTVSLTASNAGGSDTETKTDYITVGDSPVADFSGSPTSGCAPLTVHFTDQSTNNPTSWSWNFGDGGSSSSQNPTHVYPNPGIYTVSLTVSNACGSDTKTKTDYITVGDKPVAEFSGEPRDGKAPLTVVFTDSSTNDPTSWSWDFGDGGSSSSQSPTYTYDDPGTYTVSLTASNSCGSDTETKEDYITVGDEPIAEFSGEPTSGCVPLTVEFTDSSTNDPTSWSWEFGDDGTSSDQNPSHTYTEKGTYTVSLTVSNDYGEDTETKEDYITVGEEPVAEFSGEPTSGPAPLTVHFTDESTNAPTSWFWDFGNGQTSSSQNPLRHVYDSAGTYTVSLTVSNDCGEDTETKYGYIVVDPPPGVMEIVAVPPTYILYQNTPNPMVRETAIRYGVPDVAGVSICIYDVSGRVVCKLVNNAVKEPGYYTAVWDGRDEAGRNVSSGVYFYKMISNGKVLGKKMLIVK